MCKNDGIFVKWISYRISRENTYANIPAVYLNLFDGFRRRKVFSRSQNPNLQIYTVIPSDFRI